MGRFFRIEGSLGGLFSFNVIAVLKSFRYYGDISVYKYNITCLLLDYVHFKNLNKTKLYYIIKKKKIH